MTLTVYDQIQNPLTRRRNDMHRTRVVGLFPEAATVPARHYLALRQYLLNTPERFFDRGKHQLFFLWLQNRDASDRPALQQYMNDILAELSQALMFMREVNREEWHDAQFAEVDDFELLRVIDRRIHRTYLRLVEAVLAPFARIVAFFSRRDRGAGTDGLDIWAVAQELERGPMASIVMSYRHTVRNGIGHGGVTYQQSEILYRDKRGNSELIATRDVVRLCDDLIDDCNALASALTLFLLIHGSDGYRIPEELLVQELREESWTPWWSIEGVIPSRIGDKPQLLLYARAATRDFPKVQWFAIQSGIQAELFATGYDRYFISIRGPALPGWAAFDGARIRELRRAKTASLSEYTNILESIFYYQRFRLPRFLGRLDTLFEVWRLQWPIVLEESQKARKVPNIMPRNGQMHRNGWRSVLDGSVVLDTVQTEIILDQIRTYRRRIVRAAVRAASRSAGLRCLPLGFAQVAVFAKDYRKRRLRSFGLGEDLICTVRYKTIGRIKSPDIFGSTVEKQGHWRIAWNKAWLDRQAVELDTPPNWHREARRQVV